MDETTVAKIKPNKGVQAIGAKARLSLTPDVGLKRMMNKKAILCCIAALAIPAQAFAFSLRTVYQDTDASDPAALLWGLVGAAVAFPFILLALRRRLHHPSDLSPSDFRRQCTKLAFRQLGPFLGLFYIAGGLVFMVLAVVAAIGFNVWCAITSSGPFELTEQIVHNIYAFVLVYMAIWWVVSLGLSIKWLPKSLDE